MISRSTPREHLHSDTGQCLPNRLALFHRVTPGIHAGREGASESVDFLGLSGLRLLLFLCCWAAVSAAACCFLSPLGSTFFMAPAAASAEAPVPVSPAMPPTESHR